MKQVFALATLAVLVLAGCSEQGSTLGPVSEGSVFSKAAPEPQINDAGTLSVNQVVGSPDFAEQYTVEGSIDFHRSNDGKNVEFTTLTNVTVSSISPMGEDNTQTIVEKRSQSVLEAGSEIMIVERYNLKNGLEGYVLQVVYTLGSSVKIQEVSISENGKLS